MADVRVASYRHEIQNGFARAVAADMAVAYATRQGLRFGQIGRELGGFLERGGNLRIVLDIELANTHPDFTQDILDFQNQGLAAECRCYVTEQAGVFHPKLYFFDFGDGNGRVITGSANWTAPAFSSNIEHGLVIDGHFDESLIGDARQYFEALWQSDYSRPIDVAGLELYRAFWRRRRGLERRAMGRSSSQLRQLHDYLAGLARPQGFRWPSTDAAFLIGALTARGAFDTRLERISIDFAYGGAAVSHHGRRGYYGKGDVAYSAVEVVHQVPAAVAERITPIVAPATVEVTRLGAWSYRVAVDYSGHPTLMNDLRQFFGDASSHRTFQIPRQLKAAERALQIEFLRGYSLACGLVSSGTYDPTHNEQVWLRPTTQNELQFDELVALLVTSVGIPVYQHRRATRDVEVKIRCEDWLEIGFGVDWLDHILEEGARLNGALQASPDV